MACGHNSSPEPSVIVTLLSSRPGTLEATSWAIPLTEVGGRVVVPDSRTAAEEAPWLSPKTWLWELGRTSSTSAPETPCTESIVSASWPCRARW